MCDPLIVSLLGLNQHSRIIGQCTICVQILFIIVANAVFFLCIITDLFDV